MSKHSEKEKQRTEKTGAGERDPKLPANDGAGLSGGRTRIAVYALAASVSLLTFLAYLKGLHNGFVNWDDAQYVSENLHIRTLNCTFMKWAFFDFHVANWHPLTWISHALDYALWGLNPFGHHFINNSIHAANTFLVVMLAVKLLNVHREKTASEGANTFLSDHGSLIAGGVAGSLFGLHPLHVESVAWLAERKDLLCAFFFLLSIMTYVKYAERRKTEDRSQKSEGNGKDESRQRIFYFNRQYIIALCFFSLALLSKPMAVSLPAVLLIVDWYPFKRIQSVKSFWPVFVEKLPFIALSLASSILTILAQKAGNAMLLMKFLPLSTRLAVAAKAVIDYLRNMIFPLNLSPYYPYPEHASFLSFEYLVPALLAIGSTILCLRAARKHKLWLSVWSCYVITLLPVLGIIQVGGQAMADRYTYLPSLGPFLLMGVSAAWISRKTEGIQKQTLKTFTLFFPILLLLSCLAYLTVRQIDIWKNDFTLWDHVIKNQSREVPFVYYHRGLAFLATGRNDRAMEDFNKAIALDPSDHYAYVNRGLLYSVTGQTDKALEDFDKAIALNPRSSAAYTNKGMAYGRAGLFERAIEQFSRAIDLNPDVPVDYGNRGLAYFLAGQHDSALGDLNKAIQLDENYSEAYGTRGNLYLKTGNKELALSDFRKACELGDPKGCEVLKQYTP